MALLAVGFVSTLIVGRLIQMQVVDSASYRTLAQHERVTTIPIPAVRGQITSSDGTVLAMTVQTYQVAADPPLIKNTTTLAKASAQLAALLRMRPATVQHLLSHPTSREYVLLDPSVDVTTADEIAKLGDPGFILTPEYTRAYPGGDLAAGLLGFTDTNTATGVMTGEAGLEAAYNSVLAGRSGEIVEEKGPDGPIPGTQSTIRKVKPASSLRLTIQSDIQWEAERECAAQVRAFKARTCTVVVIQPRTGRVLALAQYPTFNPGKPIASLAQTTDLPIAEVFAPGSTAKVITAAAAFQ